VFFIDFEPVGRRGEFSGQETLLECARELSVDIVSICGGGGSCEGCKIRVVIGQVSELTPDEELVLTPQELEQGYRLACKAYPLSDVKLHVPPESLTAPQRTQIEGLEVVIDIDPPIRVMNISIDQPTLEAPRADVKSLWQALAAQGVPSGVIDFRVQQSLSRALRDNEWQVQVALRNNEIIAVRPQSSPRLGLAVDIGTTKIAGYLIDLESGRTLTSKGLMNPQISYGEDVVSRITAASKSLKDADRLQGLLIETLNELAKELSGELDSDPADIIEAVVVGNTAIHHLVLGLPVKQLGLSPYVPTTNEPLDVKARDLGIDIAPGAYVQFLPNIAGYVGADHVAMLLATNLSDARQTTLAIDIGTNTEICLNHNGEMTSVSCASGPAFEGAHIKFGMRAAPGAIEHFRIVDGNSEIQTIGGADPVGICGSGLLDIVAQLRKNEIVDQRGRMRDHSRIQRMNGQSEFILAERSGYPPVTLTQKDVRELQLAKAAIRMGIVALAEHAGIKEEDIDKVIIAGAFGTFINVKSAITIGMLPDLPLDRYKQVGNAAGTGARMALISTEEREKANQLAQEIGYIELAKVPNFNIRYAEATYLSRGRNP